METRQSPNLSTGNSPAIIYFGILLTTSLTIGPATRICQNNAIGKFIRAVLTQMERKSPLKPFLKAKAATKLIIGHITKTVENCIVKITTSGRLVSAATNRHANLWAYFPPINVCNIMTVAISQQSSVRDIAKELMSMEFAAIM